MARSDKQPYAPTPIPAFKDVAAVERFLDDELHRISVALAPAPGGIVINQTNIDLVAGGDNIWTKAVADTVFQNGIPPLGATYSYSAYFYNSANSNALVSLGFGVDGAEPVLTMDSALLVPDEAITLSGTGIIENGLNPGQSIAMWAKGTRARIGTSFNGVWSYKRTNGDPGDGEINHHDNQIRMVVDDEDKDGTNRSAELDNVQVNDTITAPGQQWTITFVSSTILRYDFEVSPAQRIPSEGDYTFTFDTGISGIGEVWLLGGVRTTYFAIEARN